VVRKPSRRSCGDPAQFRTTDILTVKSTAASSITAANRAALFSNIA